jgi:hypothetical protein
MLKNYPFVSYEQAKKLITAFYSSDRSFDETPINPDVLLNYYKYRNNPKPKTHLPPLADMTEFRNWLMDLQFFLLKWINELNQREDVEKYE